MKKTIKNKGLKLEIPITNNMFPFTEKKAANKKYIRAAKEVAKGMLEHFKKDGWDLSYSQYIEDVFYAANKEHLETYLFNELKNQNLAVKFGGPHGLTIGKCDDNKSKRRKSKSS